MFSKFIKKAFTNSKIDNYNYFLELLQKEPFTEQEIKEEFDQLSLNINEKDSKGNSLLNHCIENSKFEAALWLIENDIDVSLQNNSGINSFHLAVEKKEEKILQKVLNKETININEKDKFGRIVLQDLVVEGELSLAKLLIDYGADINSQDKNHRNVIFDALSYGDESFVLYLLDLNDPKVDLNNVDTKLNTVMHHSEVVKNETIAQKMIESGADTTIVNAKGETFLTIAAKNENLELAKKLIELSLKNGANVNTKTTFDNTIFMEIMKVFSAISPLEKERRKTILDIAKNILSYGGDINAINQDEENALFDAVRAGDIELIAFLLNNGVNPNIININGDTAFSELIYKGIECIDHILLMLEFDANPCIKNMDGQTVFEVLNQLILHTHNKKQITNETMLGKINLRGQYMVVLKEILEYVKDMIDLDFLDSNGNPLLFDPLLYDHAQLFRLYLIYGLNIHAVSKSGHNIFYAYVLKVFEDNNTKVEFQENLSRLVSKRVNHNFHDAIGWTVLHKILFTTCNEKLFDILTKMVKFDYSITDNLGRSVIHNAVWNGNVNIIRKLHRLNTKLVMISDGYGMLPIMYAALLGSQPMVLLFVELKANKIETKSIPQNAIDKFSPMLKNLPKIKEGLDDEELVEKIDTLLYQIQLNFNVPVSLMVK
jgi:ankyrin repeat protein